MTARPRKDATRARPRPPLAEAGEVGTIRHDEETAHGEVDLIAKKLENGTKPGLKTKFGRLKAHLQHYRAYINYIYVNSDNPRMARPNCATPACCTAAV